MEQDEVRRGRVQEADWQTDEGPLSIYNLFTISSRENIAKIWNHCYHRAHHRRIADSHKSITPPNPPQKVCYLSKLRRIESISRQQADIANLFGQKVDSMV